MERLSLNECQGALYQWTYGVMPQDVSVRTRVERAKEEWDEVEEALLEFEKCETPECGLHLAEEMGDVIIGVLGAMAVLSIDAERVVLPKIDIMYRKYNPVRNAQLRRDGLEYKEALATQKKEWQR
jgi:uncharacterized protein YabN with tetrapyrrole methylase and pyrophosphatase domain